MNKIALQIINQWIAKHPKHSKHKADLIDVFSKAFSCTYFPSKAYFGLTKKWSSLSLVTGNIYFFAIDSGNGCWLLVSDNTFNYSFAEYHILRSSLSFNSPLYWLKLLDLNRMGELVENNELWNSYTRATYLIFQNKTVTSYQNRTCELKINLSNLLGDNQQNYFLKLNEIRALECKSIKKNKLDKEIKKVPKYPDKKEVVVTQYTRSPLIVEACLRRAKGYCESCNKPAPFKRKFTLDPYLEVHHIIPLSKGGEDSLENTLALCPNCHRELHYGVITK